MEELLAAGWQRHEMPAKEPPTIVLEVDKTCGATAGVGECGTRPRTFSTPVVTRSAGGGNDGDARSPEEAPPDRAALAAAQLQRSRQAHQAAPPTRAEWQTAPASDARRDEPGRLRAGTRASLVIHGEMVMDADEAGHMGELARIAVTSHDEPTRQHGRLLEVGYGLGLSAASIQQARMRDPRPRLSAAARLLPPRGRRCY